MQYNLYSTCSRWARIGSRILRIGSMMLHVGSAKLLDTNMLVLAAPKFYIVGIDNCPTRSPNASGFALQCNIARLMSYHFICISFKLKIKCRELALERRTAHLSFYNSVPPLLVFLDLPLNT